ncbi:MAG: hypothetical protein G01um101425_297 [Candidatus Peregrinibacteria bacterium Gr01-1014_25]|nr:MAG: hypothetical protein G01um101425_297 [Candidatus Peregrinibacteria bacterium Gr01-1014_25]
MVDCASYHLSQHDGMANARTSKRQKEDVVRVEGRPTAQELQERIAEVIVARRKSLGLTLQDIANAIGMSIGSASNLCSGNHTYPLHTLNQLASALRLDLIHLVYLIEEPWHQGDPALERVGILLKQRSQ